MIEPLVKWSLHMIEQSVNCVIMAQDGQDSIIAYLVIFLNCVKPPRVSKVALLN